MLCACGSTEELRHVLHDDVCAVLAQLICLAYPVDPDDEGEMPGVPGRDARLRVLEHGGVRGAAAQVLGGGQEGVRAGLPFRCRSWATMPSTRASNRSAIPAELSTSTVLALEETMALRRPAARTALMYRIVPS